MGSNAEGLRSPRGTEPLIPAWSADRAAGRGQAVVAAVSDLTLAGSSWMPGPMVEEADTFLM